MAVLYGADMEGDLPGWFLIFAGITYFVYQLCDNMDGKQARRTGSSSPLGMLFDHGIDCFTSLLNNLIFQRVLQVGNNMTSLTFMSVTMFPFYYATLEQYYTGELIMQKVNGVDDGSIAYILVCFLSAYYGCVYLWANEYSLIGFQDVRGTHYVAGVVCFFLTFCIADK